MGILRTDKISGLETPTPVTGSVSFDGTGDYLAVTPINNSFVNWWQSDFTIEAWIYADSYADWWFNDAGAGSDIPAMVGHFEHDGATNYWSFGPVSDNTVKFYYWKGSQNHTFVTSDKVVVGEWSHIAMTYSVANGAKLFINGRGTDYISLSGTPQADISAAEFNVGQYNSESITGYVSNLRILNGTALYTSDFTPPTHALEVIGDTVLLCCNNPDSAAADGTGKTITANGNAAASTFSPGLTRDFTYGTEFQGVTTFDTQGYFVPPSGTTEQRGRGRGLFGGGNANPGSQKNTIDFIQIQTQGNALDFGDLTSIRERLAGAAGAIRGLFAGGQVSPTTNVIEFVTISTTSNATDFGDLTTTRMDVGGASNTTRAVFFAGGTPGSNSNIIDFVTIASIGNAQDFGDLTDESSKGCGCGSPTRGIIFIGTTVQYITWATTGNAQDFGDTTITNTSRMALSDSTRGIVAGGYASPSKSNVIEYITIATLGNAQDFGDLTNGAYEPEGASSNSIRGVLALGDVLVVDETNAIDYITIQTTGNARDFGDLTQRIKQGAACSDSHGGLS
jgi:hypothetical protein